MGKVRSTGARWGALGPRTTEAVQQVGVQVEESVTGPVPAAVARLEEPDLDDFAERAVAGTALTGEFRCADCGYGAVIQRVLPLCPMCGGVVWESRGPLPSS